MSKTNLEEEYIIAYDAYWGVYRNSGKLMYVQARVQAYTRL